jgi:hypothetical protein
MNQFVVFLICAFLIGVILVWRRFRAVDRRLGQMQQEINELRWMESRLLMLGMKAPKVDHSEADPDERTPAPPRSDVLRY